MDVLQFRKLPVLGILRGIAEPDVEPLAQTIISSGLKTIEITMNTESAPDLISRMIRLSDGLLTVGAGTVLSLEDAKIAVDAGASFIVSPMFVPAVVEYCVKNAIPVFPGALTPQEVFTAWRAGAMMVKIFPANIVGPQYIKGLKGPFNDVELLACGGISPENIQDYFFAGVSAVAFGASIFRLDWIKQGQFQLIEQGIRDLLSNLPQQD